MKLDIELLLCGAAWTTGGAAYILWVPPPPPPPPPSPFFCKMTILASICGFGAYDVYRRWLRRTGQVSQDSTAAPAA